MTIAMPFLATPTTARVACARCMRYLKHPASIARGLGSSCARKLGEVRLPAAQPVSIDAPALPFARRTASVRVRRFHRFLRSSR